VYVTCIYIYYGIPRSHLCYGQNLVNIFPEKGMVINPLIGNSVHIRRQVKYIPRKRDGHESINRELSIHITSIRNHMG
jgi:hypothetical protein